MTGNSAEELRNSRKSVSALLKGPPGERAIALPNALFRKFINALAQHAHKVFLVAGFRLNRQVQIPIASLFNKSHATKGFAGSLNQNSALLSLCLVRRTQMATKQVWSNGQHSLRETNDVR